MGREPIGVSALFPAVTPRDWKPRCSNSTDDSRQEKKRCGRRHRKLGRNMRKPGCYLSTRAVTGRTLPVSLSLIAPVSSVVFVTVTASAAPVGDKPAHSKGETGDDSAGPDAQEPPQQLFPHVYGPIDTAAVVAELAVERSDDGHFLSIEGLC